MWQLHASWLVSLPDEVGFQNVNETCQIAWRAQRMLKVPLPNKVVFKIWIWTCQIAWRGGCLNPVAGNDTSPFVHSIISFLNNHFKFWTLEVRSCFSLFFKFHLTFEAQILIQENLADICWMLKSRCWHWYLSICKQHNLIPQQIFQILIIRS